MGRTYQGLETANVSGRVTDAATGRALPGASVQVVSEFPQPGGSLLIYDDDHSQTAGDGAYAVEVPRAPRYRASIRHPELGASRTTPEWPDPGIGAGHARDLGFEAN